MECSENILLSASQASFSSSLDYVLFTTLVFGCWFAIVFSDEDVVLSLAFPRPPFFSLSGSIWPFPKSRTPDSDVSIFWSKKKSPSVCLVFVVLFARENLFRRKWTSFIQPFRRVYVMKNIEHVLRGSISIWVLIRRRLRRPYPLRHPRRRLRHWDHRALRCVPCHRLPFSVFDVYVLSCLSSWGKTGRWLEQCRFSYCWVIFKFFQFEENDREHVNMCWFSWSRRRGCGGAATTSESLSFKSQDRRRWDQRQSNYRCTVPWRN